MTPTSRGSGPTLAHLGRLTEAAFERHGDYPAVFFEGRWYASAALFQRSKRIAAGLVEHGLEPNDRVLVTMPNMPEVPVLYAAIWRAGGVVTPAMHVLSALELRHVIADAGPRFVITTTELLEKLGEALAGLDAPSRVVCVDPEHGTALPLAALEATDTGRLVPREPDDLAALLYTGGTTGRSKGVMVSHAGLSFAGWTAADSEASFAVERELLTLPLSHSFGLVEMLSAMHSGLRKVWVMLPRFEAGVVLSLIQEHRIEKTQAVPSMLHKLLAQPIEQFDVSSLRWVGCGGAPLAIEVIHEFSRRIPSVTLIEGYGLTESCSVATANPPERPKPGSVGPLMRGVEIRVVDPRGTALPPHETGEICIRSPGLMRGYWGEPDLTAEVVKDGWLHTGDVGYVDDDGYVFILDRKKDVIIRGGFNVFPRDVEDAIVEHPSVQMAAVIGRPDRVHGEEVVAFVALRDGAHAAPDELVAWARQRIGAHKYPREIHIVESLPLTGVGKPDRKVLRARLA
jgi:long-chain acyl-CoA synthetase